MVPGLRISFAKNEGASPVWYNLVLTYAPGPAYDLVREPPRSNMAENRADSQRVTTEQVAKILGVSKRTLKTWLQNGKVPEPARNPKNNYRIWTLADVDALRRILGNEDQ